MARHDEQIMAAIGSNADLGAFSMWGPYLARHNGNSYERVFPFPADLVREKGARTAWRALRPSAVDITTNSDCRLPFQMLDIQDKEEPPDKPLWLKEEDLRNYLNNGYVGDSVPIHSDDLFEVEYRTGIAMDYNRRGVSDGQLYSAGFIRLHPGVVLLVELPDDSPLADRFGSGACHTIRFGGEGHAARIRHLTERAVLASSWPRPSDKQYKIVFLTSTYFAEGLRPASLTADGAGLVSVCANRSVAVGGWNLADHRPRTMYHYLPAGSVMYFDHVSQPVSSPLVDQPADCLPLAQLGFGEFAYGSWGSA